MIWVVQYDRRDDSYDTEVIGAVTGDSPAHAVGLAEKHANLGYPDAPYRWGLDSDGYPQDAPAALSKDNTMMWVAGLLPPGDDYYLITECEPGKLRET
jgi:hypothetical protein